MAFAEPVCAAFAGTMEASLVRTASCSLLLCSLIVVCSIRSLTDVTRHGLATHAGGVESMEQINRWFFPANGMPSSLSSGSATPRKSQSLHPTGPSATGNSSFYCKYNNHTLQAYSAIMHFTGALASIPASYFTQHWGRKGWVLCNHAKLCHQAMLSHDN